MYCSKCGKKLTGKERFCPRCGNEVSMITENDIQQTVADNVSATKFKNKTHEQKKRAGRTGKRSHRGRRLLLVAACSLILALIGGTVYYFVITQMSGEQYLAAVQNEEGKWGYINEEGKEVIPCEYDFAVSGWTQGVTVIGKKIGEDDEGYSQYKYGLINAKGEMVIEPQYDDFNMGNGIIAMAEQVDQDEEGEPVLVWGLFNSEGDMITGFKYQSEYSLSACLNENGLAVVSDATGEMDSDGDIIYNYGVVNEKGEEIIPLQYPYISDDADFGNQGLIPTMKEIGNSYKYGFVNYQNEREIPYRYEYAYNFSENGLAAVLQEDKWGYINTNGDIVIPCKYDSAYSFSDKGLAFVEEDGECKCIDEKGETVIPAGAYREYGRWVAAYWLKGDDLAKIQMESNDGNVSWGIINQEGDMIIEPDVASGVTRINVSGPFTLHWNPSEDNQEQGYYKFATQEGELLNNTYDYAGYFAENGWCCVGTKIGTDVDGNNQYRYSYIDEKEKTVLELPQKYIFAATFISVDQK